MNPQLTQANELYRSAVGDRSSTMSLRRQISNLQLSIAIYLEELKKLSNSPASVAVASLQKNLGLANLRLAQKLSLEDSSKCTRIVYNVEQAIGYLCNAWGLQEKREQDGPWGTKLEEAMGECFQTAFHARKCLG